MSAWAEYKKKLGETRPWDMLNPEIVKVSQVVAEKRMSICRECDRFIKITTQCKECGCIMSAKTKLEPSKCPLNKW